MLWQIKFYRSEVDMISAAICRLLLWRLCNLPCVYALFWLVSIASYVFKSPNIYFQGTKYEINREYVVYLHSSLWMALCCFRVARTTWLADISSNKVDKQVTGYSHSFPEAERFQINWWTKCLIYWLKRGCKISVVIIIRLVFQRKKWTLMSNSTQLLDLVLQLI